MPGINHLVAVRAFEKAGFSVVRQGKHIIMSDGTRILTIPRNNTINAFALGGIVRDAGLRLKSSVNFCNVVFPPNPAVESGAAKMPPRRSLLRWAS